MSRVLLAGAGGFVGEATLAALLAAGHEVEAVSRSPRPAAEGVRWHAADLLAAGAAERLIDEAAPELLLDLAWYAEHGRFWTALENVGWVGATLRLLEAFATAGGRRALVAGSCAEYAWGPEATLSERSSPLRPATLYGACKHASHVAAAALCEQLGAQLAWGRLFFLYGPREHPERLVAAVARGLLAGERVPTSAGEQVRDFMHVEDAGRALAALLASDVCGAVNVASGAGVSVREVVSTIGELAGRPELVDLGALPARPGDPEAIVADTARLREEVGFAPSFTLREGLSATLRWWRERIAGG